MSKIDLDAWRAEALEEIEEFSKPTMNVGWDIAFDGKDWVEHNLKVVDLCDEVKRLRDQVNHLVGVSQVASCDHSFDAETGACNNCGLGVYDND